jgi:hypothetical protein
MSQDEHNPAVEPQGASAATATPPASRQTLKPAPPWVQGDPEMDPERYDELRKLYDNSFRNIAEGEVVKGTVLKVTDSEVVVDVGYKSEGIIPVDEFVDPVTSWTSCSSGPKTVKATSCCRARRPRR